MVFDEKIVTFTFFSCQVKHLIYHYVDIFDVLKDDGIKKVIYQLKRLWNEIQFFILSSPQHQKGFFWVHAIRRHTYLEIVSQSLEGVFPLPIILLSCRMK